MNERLNPSPWRCLLVWLAVTTGVLWLLEALSADLVALRAVADINALAAVGFDVLLGRLAAAALSACAVWFWFMTTLIAAEATRGRCSEWFACPAAVRRVLLAACGVALVGGFTAPAHSEPSDIRVDRDVVAGLPLPDRPTRDQRPPPAGAGQALSEAGPPESPPVSPLAVRVAPGDCLWAIAESTLPPGAPNAEIDASWRVVYARNRDVVGDDPNLIHPGTRLALPPAPGREDLR